MRLLRSKTDDPWLTKELAAYPADLNKKLADMFAETIKQQEARQRTCADKLVQAGAHGNCLIRNSSRSEQQKREFCRAPLETSAPLRGAGSGIANQREAEKEAQNYVGGLARTVKSVQKLSRLRSLGKKLRRALEEKLAPDHTLIATVINAIGSKEENPGPTEEQLDVYRNIIARIVGAEDIGPINNGKVHTPLRAHLQESWRKAGHDPEEHVYTWLTQGTPAGILHVPEHCGIFPRLKEEAAQRLELEELLQSTD